MVAGILGKFMQGGGKIWYIALGVLMIMMSLQTFEVFTFFKGTNLQSKNTKKGYIGALISGILGRNFLISMFNTCISCTSCNSWKVWKYTIWNTAFTIIWNRK